MRYNINIVAKNLSPICYLPSGRLVCYRSGWVFVLENEKIVKPKEVITNTIAAYVVHLPSIPFNVLALFLPKKVSAPPAISPEIPALLPDCNITIKIRDIHAIM